MDLLTFFLRWNSCVEIAVTRSCWERLKQYLGRHLMPNLSRHSSTEKSWQGTSTRPKAVSSYVLEQLISFSKLLESTREDLLIFGLQTRRHHGPFHAWKAQSQTVPLVKKQIPTQRLGSGIQSPSPSAGGCFLA